MVSKSEFESSDRLKMGVDTLLEAQRRISFRVGTLVEAQMASSGYRNASSAQMSFNPEWEHLCNHKWV